MLLDADYQWALIGSGSAKYLWILSRTPELSQETLNTILAEAQRRGYDTSDFRFEHYEEQVDFIGK